jgi:predicted neuraminidase
VAVLRCGDRSVARVVASRTADGGAAWTSAAPIDVPNPDSSVALVRLRDGSLLMAANPAERGRSRLALLRSTDGGASWTDEATVEQGEEGSEFSYPTLVASDDGGAWLSYTFRRTGIRVRRYAAAPRAEAAP